MSPSVPRSGLDPEVGYRVDTGGVIVELRSVPDCADLAPVRQALDAALADLGWPAGVTELVGDYPSPSVLVNGVDVMGGKAGNGTAGRPDPPTAGRIPAARPRAQG